MKYAMMVEWTNEQGFFTNPALAKNFKSNEFVIMVQWSNGPVEYVILSGFLLFKIGGQMGKWVKSNILVFTFALRYILDMSKSMKYAMMVKW